MLHFGSILNFVLALWVDYSPKVRETGVQSQVNSYQRLNEWYLMPPRLTISIVRYESRVKWCRKVLHPPRQLGVVTNEKGDFGLPTTVANFTVIYIYIGLAVRVFANGPGDLGSIPGRVIPKTQKMVLDDSLLNTQHYKVRIKGKVGQSREGVAPSPTPWCSSYRKGSLRVTLDYGRQLYFIYIY